MLDSDDMDTAKPKAKENQRQIVLFDRDEFYGLTLELVVFNFSLESPIVVSGRRTQEAFMRDFLAGKVQNAVYIFDEYYLTTPEQKALIEQIKDKDPKAVVLCYTVSLPEEIELKESYDRIVLKTSRANQNTLIQALSDILGLEFEMNNSDPELDGDR